MEPQSLLDFDLGEGESSDDSDFRIEDHPEESDDYSINTDDENKSKLLGFEQCTYLSKKLANRFLTKAFLGIVKFLQQCTILKKIYSINIIIIMLLFSESIFINCLRIKDQYLPIYVLN